MFRFILEKMWSKRWMMLALLIGNVFFIAITCSNAMYGQAALQRTLIRNLENYYLETDSYPGLTAVSLRSSVFSGSLKESGVLTEAKALADTLPKRLGVPQLERVDHYAFSPSNVEEEVERSRGIPSQLALGTMTDLEDHVEIVSGEMYSDEPDADGVIDVMVSKRGMTEMNLLLDERIIFPKYILPSGEPLKVRVCGVFENSEAEDLYWVRTPATFKREMLMPEKLFNELFLEGDINDLLIAQFYVLLDHTGLQGEKAQDLYDTAGALKAEANTINRNLTYQDNFSGVVKAFIPTAQKVNVTLWVLQVPNFILLAAFIFMVSRQMLDMEQNEIAVIKSRGASRGQIITTYLLQSVTIAGAAVVLGIPLGMFLVQVLGSANAFMEFVSRRALPVQLTAKVLLFVLAAALLSIAAMVLPVFRHSSVTIVSHKQKKARKSKAPLWQRLFLDVVILGVSLYGLYSYNSRKEELAQRVIDGAALDPLLFISSSLFMIGAGLFALRILPLITHLVFLLFRKRWSPALYTAFLQVIRNRYSHNFIMVFLVMTIAMGIFNAQAARTINSNEENNIAYSVGADLVIMERWKTSDGAEINDMNEREDVTRYGAPKGWDEDTADLPFTPPAVTYKVPDFGVYRDMEGVANAAQVLVDDKASIQLSKGSVNEVKLMGIHTKSFGQVAWMQDDLLPYRFYEYLNTLAADAQGVLVSTNFQENYGVQLGDTIYYQGSFPGTTKMIRGTVYGFIDYWPSYAPYSYSKNIDGTYFQKTNYLVVGNLAQMQDRWGITPYQVWMDAADSTSFMYAYAEENHMSFRTFEDASDRLVALKNDPVFQGTNGILTVGFIVVLLLCAVGFLIYWILSIQSRALQFGIYRAMGMSMKEILTMLLGEQFFISAMSIATGIVVGVLTSRLYIPLIQMAYAAYDSPLPLKVINAPEDMVRLMIVIGLMILVCMGILGWLISRMKIAQVLKLGED